MSRQPATGRRRVRLTPAQGFQAAQRLHWQGRLNEAEQLYRAVLKIAPNHAGALHRLGVLSSEQGQFEQAVGLFRRALATDPNSARAHNDLGIALAALRRPKEAADQYAKAVALEPGFAEAHNNLGDALSSLGRNDEALASFERAVELNPDFAEAHNNLGNGLAVLQRPAEAIAHYERAVTLKPELAEAHFNCAIALTTVQQPEQAIAQYEKAIAIKPDYADAYAGIGKALTRQSRHADAIGKFEQALALKPDSADAHNSLGNALAALNRHTQAASHYRRALEIRPNYGEAHNNLGNVLVALNLHQEAIEHYRIALALSPSSCETLNNLGSALLVLKRREEALTLFEQALAIRPELAETANNIGTALTAMERHADAVPHFWSALALKPNFAIASSNLGAALLQLNQVDEAVACFDRALAINPDVAAAHHGLGNAYVALGRIAEAQQAFDRAVTLEPRNPEFYRGFAEAASMRAEDPHFLSMQDLERDIDSLSVDHQTELHFALAKAYADVKQFDRSFRHLLAGNALKRREVDYDEVVELELLRRLRVVFTPDLIRRMGDAGEPSKVPVFIVGMPRSGTTLVEQMLASHLRVFGAGELMDFQRAAAAICEPPGAAIPYPEMLPAMSGQDLRRLGARYLAGVTTKAPEADRITDKMPANFRLVGLIHLALPNARIIHVRRDPLDTCVSCFSKLFSGQQPFTYDLGELGRYYRAYETLMAHWRRVLPEGVMLEVQYEDLVAEFEVQARRIVAYCGLEWDERCLSFHETQRPVRTASAAQVRQPLYRSSLRRWRAYEPWLGPLLDALGSRQPGEAPADFN